MQLTLDNEGPGIPIKTIWRSKVIEEAIEAVKDLCDEYQHEYKPVSMRSALEVLGYDNTQQNAIIKYVASKGFTYCLDPIIAATHFDPNNPRAVNDMVTDTPDYGACFWGPDQLKSRLQSLR